MEDLHCSCHWASLSEPHTSGETGRNIYISYVHPVYSRVLINDLQHFIAARRFATFHCIFLRKSIWIQAREDLNLQRSEPIGFSVEERELVGLQRQHKECETGPNVLLRLRKIERKKQVSETEEVRLQRMRRFHSHFSTLDVPTCTTCSKGFSASNFIHGLLLDNCYFIPSSLSPITLRLPMFCSPHTVPWVYFCLCVRA